MLVNQYPAVDERGCGKVDNRWGASSGAFRRPRVRQAGHGWPGRDGHCRHRGGCGRSSLSHHLGGRHRAFCLRPSMAYRACQDDPGQLTAVAAGSARRVSCRQSPGLSARVALGRVAAA
jgi:hypothetical protein